MFYELNGLQAFSAKSSNLGKDAYLYSSLGNIPIVLPSIVNLQKNFDIDFVRSKSPSVPSLLQVNQMAVKLWPMAVQDKLLIDASEFLNSIYEDLYQINELVSLKKHPALIPEGLCIFYNGFLIVNNLQPKFLSKVLLQMKTHNLMKGTCSLDESVT